jgi:chromosome partitioning protein
MAQTPKFRVVGGNAPQSAPRIASTDGEHPAVIVGDVASRPRPRGHVITLANEKGGVGKSTLALHLGVALCDAGFRVAAIDLDRRQQTLARGLTHRSGTARRLGIALPTPSHVVLQQASGAMLHQEIARVGWDCDYVIIDAPGHDSPISRRAIAMADTLVTPVNSSFVDIDLLGEFDPVTLRFKQVGYFASMIAALSDERLRQRLSRIDWVVAPNRVRHGVSRNQQNVDSALRRLAPRAGFRLAGGLSERVAYRELSLLGLTHLDLKRIPQFAKAGGRANHEIQRLVSDLALPQRHDDAALFEPA